MDAAHSVAAALLDAEAFKVSLDPLFTWTSGLKAPVYCDLRSLNSDVATRRLIVDELVKLVPEGTDVIAGTATAGITWAAWVAEKLSLPMVYVRPKVKEHGAKRQVEGNFPNGATVVMVEDLISTGGSCIRTCEALRDECEALVSKVIAINNYTMPKATINFAEAGLELETVTTSPVIFSVAHERGAITDEQEKMLLDFVNAPADWAGRYGLA
jgi:orotate phosphoribosyltransferase